MANRSRPFHVRYPLQAECSAVAEKEALTGRIQQVRLRKKNAKWLFLTCSIMAMLYTHSIGNRL